MTVGERLLATGFLLFISGVLAANMTDDDVPTAVAAPIVVCCLLGTATIIVGLVVLIWS